MFTPPRGAVAFARTKKRGAFLVVVCYTPLGAMASLAECSREPVSQIDVSMLSDSRFLVRSARKYAYRDAAGRVNLHLLRLARLEIDEDPDVPDDVHEKLHKWLRHAERWAERTRQVLLSTVRSKKGGLVPKKGGLIPKKKDFFLINLGQSSSTCTP